MTEDKLVYMANQIATAFASQGADAAADAVADHINKFWEPRMRARLLAHVASGGAGLSEPVLAAVPAIRRPDTVAAH
jgi:formate dehydrogenase subunit delta